MDTISQDRGVEEAIKILGGVHSGIGEALSLLGAKKKELHETQAVKTEPEEQELALTYIAAAEAPSLRRKVSTLTLERSELIARVKELEGQLALPNVQGTAVIPLEDRNSNHSAGLDIKECRDLSLFKGIMGSKNVLLAPPMRTLQPCFPNAQVDIVNRLSPVSLAYSKSPILRY